MKELEEAIQGFNERIEEVASRIEAQGSNLDKAKEDTKKAYT